MNKSQATTTAPAVTSQAFNRMPVEERAEAAERMYAEAVALYATTDLSVRKIAELCQVTPEGLRAHIRRNHRQLLFARCGLDTSMADSVKVRPRKGQTLAAHLKYRDAIDACGDPELLEYNLSQIARKFGHAAPALIAQLRVHYPELMKAREITRQRLGYAENKQRGARSSSEAVYSEAVEMYRTTEMTAAEVAEKCDVSKSGLVQFMRYYRPEVLRERADRRELALQSKANPKKEK